MERSITLEWGDTRCSRKSDVSDTMHTDLTQ
jgi:hypothetical protein